MGEADGLAEKAVNKELFNAEAATEDIEFDWSKSLGLFISIML